MSLVGSTRLAHWPIVEASYADAAQASPTFFRGGGARRARPLAIPYTSSLDPKDRGPWRSVHAVLARIADADEVVIPSALRWRSDESIDRLIARLRSAAPRAVAACDRAPALRCRQQPIGWRAHACSVPLLDQATILCIGRGRFLSALTTPIGERVSLIGAMTSRPGALSQRPRHRGVVIGDGSPRVVEALLAFSPRTLASATFRRRARQRGHRRRTAAQSRSVEHDPVRLVECLLRSFACRRSKATQAHAQIARDRRRARSGDWPARRDACGAISTARCGRPRMAAARSRWALLLRDMTDHRPSMMRAAVQPAGAQYRFRLPGAGWLDPRGLPPRPTAQRPRGRRRIASVLRQTMLGADRDRPASGHDHAGDAQVTDNPQQLVGGGRGGSRTLSQGCRG